ncbi:hypothetical protein MMC25_006665 [Agyrium rufum]|nr:hypothetical protein [Agyrium rufum]
MKVFSPRECTITVFENKEEHLMPGLLSVNEQIRQEAMSVFYNRARFFFQFTVCANFDGMLFRCEEHNCRRYGMEDDMRDREWMTDGERYTSLRGAISNDDFPLSLEESVRRIVVCLDAERFSSNSVMCWLSWMCLNLCQVEELTLVADPLDIDYYTYNRLIDNLMERIVLLPQLNSVILKIDPLNPTTQETEMAELNFADCQEHANEFLIEMKSEEAPGKSAGKLECWLDMRAFHDSPSIDDLSGETKEETKLLECLKFQRAPNHGYWLLVLRL